MNRFILLIFVVIIGFSLLTEGWKKGRRHRKRKVTKFMHVSDVHFDLFYNQSISKDTSCRSTEGFKIADYETTYGRIGCDSPEWLLESTLGAMKEKGKDAEFILLTGKGGVIFFFFTAVLRIAANYCFHDSSLLTAVTETIIKGRDFTEVIILSWHRCPSFVCQCSFLFVSFELIVVGRSCTHNFVF